jgi:hypothetical protein
MYLLEFVIVSLDEIWIQQGRRESKKFRQLWTKRWRSLRTDLVLLPRNIIFPDLVLISVRDWVNPRA